MPLYNLPTEKASSCAYMDVSTTPFYHNAGALSMPRASDTKGLKNRAKNVAAMTKKGNFRARKNPPVITKVSR